MGWSRQVGCRWGRGVDANSTQGSSDPSEGVPQSWRGGPIMTRLRARRRLGVATVLIVGCALFVSSGTARAGTAGGITGTIRDAATSEPIGLATVTVPELKRGATTDAQGHYFILNLLPGKYTIRVALLGYIPQVR